MGNKNGRGTSQRAISHPKAKQIDSPNQAQDYRHVGADQQRKSSHGDVEQAVVLWFRENAKDLAISGAQMLEKASQVARQLEPDFTPTDSWLEQLRTREGIVFHSMKSEAAVFEDCGEAEVCEAPEQYDPADQFNFCETALLYRAVPTGVLADSGDSPTGGTTAEERLTLAFMTNASGSDKCVFVIGKEFHPRCFARVKKVPLPYFANTNAWMTGSLFSQLCTSFDAEMRQQNRRVALFLDAVTCHNIDVSLLTNLKLIHSSVQPLDQGVIQTFKCYYRTTLMRYFLSTNAATGKDIREMARDVDVLRAMEWIKTAWSHVHPSCISECFRKAGFLSNSATGEAMFKNEPAAEENSPALDYIAVDGDLKCCGEDNDADACGPSDGSSDDDDDADMPDSPEVSKAEVFQALNVVRRYLQQNCAEYDSFFKIEKKIQKSML